MNYQALISKCQRKSGNSSGDVQLGFSLDLNEGQRVMGGEMDNWNELHTKETITTVKGTESYPYATDLSDVRTLFILTPLGNSQVLDEINYQDFRYLYGNTANSGLGMPSKYYLDPSTPGNICLFPIPNAVYTIEDDYIKVTTDMVNPTDTPFCPARWHHLLVEYALAEYYESPNGRNYDQATYHRTKWTNGLDRMRADVVRKGLKQVPIDYGSGVNEGYGSGLLNNT